MLKSSKMLQGKILAKILLTSDFSWGCFLKRRRRSPSSRRARVTFRRRPLSI